MKITDFLNELIGTNTHIYHSFLHSSSSQRSESSEVDSNSEGTGLKNMCNPLKKRTLITSAVVRSLWKISKQAATCAQNLDNTFGTYSTSEKQCPHLMLPNSSYKDINIEDVDSCTLFLRHSFLPLLFTQ